MCVVLVCVFAASVCPAGVSRPGRGPGRAQLALCLQKEVPVHHETQSQEAHPAQLLPGVPGRGVCVGGSMCVWVGRCVGVVR